MERKSDSTKMNENIQCENRKSQSHGNEDQINSKMKFCFFFLHFFLIQRINKRDEKCWNFFFAWQTKLHFDRRKIWNQQEKFCVCCKWTFCVKCRPFADRSKAVTHWHHQHHVDRSNDPEDDRKMRQPLTSVNILRRLHKIVSLLNIYLISLQHNCQRNAMNGKKWNGDDEITIRALLSRNERG